MIFLEYSWLWITCGINMLGKTYSWFCETKWQTYMCHTFFESPRQGLSTKHHMGLICVVILNPFTRIGLRSQIFGITRLGRWFRPNLENSRFFLTLHLTWCSWHFAWCSCYFAHLASILIDLPKILHVQHQFFEIF